MTRDPIVVRDDTSIDKALKIMRDNRVHRLPVLNDKGALVGIVSERDLSLLGT
ncbi:MAG: CBS domain-containing protein [Anaerolineales bacterium]|nr:MAG: CBS domain-containing protein [Anaerolineales bacterium]